MLTGDEFQTLGAEIEKHKIQKIGCDGRKKADENWVSAETSLVRDVAGGQRDMADDQCTRL